MTLDDYRKLSAEERAVADKATPGPLIVEKQAHSHGSVHYWIRTVEPIMRRDPAPPAPRSIAWMCGSLGEATRRDPREYRDDPEIKADGDAFARSRTAVPALCDAVDALLAVVDALPKCLCGKTATREVMWAGRLSIWCDGCAEARAIYDPYDLPYAPALRALLAKAPG